MDRSITLYSFTRIHLPYQLHMNSTTRQFFWVNREYAPLGKTKASSTARWWIWPDITDGDSGNASQYLYDDETAPRTKHSTEKLLRVKAQLERTVLVGFTERVDFQPRTRELP